MNFSGLEGKDPLEKFANAMAWLKAHPGGELVIPPGVYEVTESRARAVFSDMLSGKYGDNPQDVMFRPDFPYTRVLDFYGQEGTRLIADGVTLLLDGFFEPVSLRHCKDVSVRGLIIDYKRKPYSHGYIERAADGELVVRFTADMPDGFPFPRYAVCDPHTGLFRYYPFGIKQWRRFEGNTFAAQVDGETKIYAGAELYVWHSYHSRPAVCIQNAEGVTLRNVVIHAQPGMGVVGHLSRDIVLDGVSVVPSAGERMSTNTDATHFSSCYGRLILQNCVFEGHGDDAVNVHNYDHAFAPVGGSRYRLACLAADGTHTQAVDLPSVGDEMQLIARGTLDKGEKFTVTAARANGDGTCDVAFDRPLPAGSEGKYYLENASACPEFLFSHCRVRNHFARSVLIKTRRATVEKSIFEHSDLTAVVVAAEENWGEGTSSEHVEICNNVFLACGTRGDVPCAVTVYTGSREKTGKQHKKVVVKENFILCSEGQRPFAFANVQEVVAENNLIVGG